MQSNLCMYLAQEGIKMLEKKVTTLEIVGKEGASHRWEKKSLKCAARHSALQKSMFELPIPLSCSGLLEVGKWFLLTERGRCRGKGQ